MKATPRDFRRRPEVGIPFKSLPSTLPSLRIVSSFNSTVFSGEIKVRVGWPRVVTGQVQSQRAIFRLGLCQVFCLFSSRQHVIIQNQLHIFIFSFNESINQMSLLGRPYLNYLKTTMSPSIVVYSVTGSYIRKQARLSHHHGSIT